MTEARDEALAMLQQVQGFLRDLDKFGLAEQAAVPETTANSETTCPAASTTLELLRSVAKYFGYRIA